MTKKDLDKIVKEAIETASMGLADAKLPMGESGKVAIVGPVAAAIVAAALNEHGNISDILLGKDS